MAACGAGCGGCVADATPSFHHGIELVFLLHKKAPASIPRELVPLLWALSDVIVCDLRSLTIVVCDLRAPVKILGLRKL
jgi:hypothetical protein